MPVQCRSIHSLRGLARARHGRAEDGPNDVDVDPGVAYPDSAPVLITVRRREHRYETLVEAG